MKVCRVYKVIFNLCNDLEKDYFDMGFVKSILVMGADSSFQAMKLAEKELDDKYNSYGLNGITVDSEKFDGFVHNIELGVRDN